MEEYNPKKIALHYRGMQSIVEARETINRGNDKKIEPFDLVVRMVKEGVDFHNAFVAVYRPTEG